MHQWLGGVRLDVIEEVNVYALRVAIFLILVPSVVLALGAALVVVFRALMPEEPLTFREVAALLITGVISGILFVAFEKVNLMVFERVALTADEIVEFDADAVSECRKNLMLSGVGWLLPAILFAVAFVLDLPRVSAWSALLLAGSIGFACLTIGVGYRLRELNKRSWQLAMALSALSCLNVPVGCLVGLRNLRLLDQTRYLFR